MALGAVINAGIDKGVTVYPVNYPHHKRRIDL